MAKRRRTSQPRRSGASPDGSSSTAAPAVEIAEPSLSPILYQRIAGATSPAAGAPMMRVAGGTPSFRAGGNTGMVPLLSYALPEPTSYSGTNVMVLDAKGLRPRAKDDLLQFDGKKVYVDCGNPPQLQASDGSSLTIEAWIKTRTTDGFRSIVIHGQTTDKKKAEVFLRLHDGHYEFGTWAGDEDIGISTYQKNRSDADKKKLRVRNDHLGAWVHLAGVYHAQAQAWLLYCNGNLLDAVGPSTAATATTGPTAADVNLWKGGTFAWDPLSYQREIIEKQIAAQRAALAAAEAAKKATQYGSGPVVVDAPWSIGATRLDQSGKQVYGRFFDGYIAEVRIWNVARSEAEIRENMDVSMPTFAPGMLGACWRLNEGRGGEILDLSGQESHGTVKVEKPMWVQADGPIGQLAQLTRRQPDSRIEGAFKLAHDGGYFDSLVFPRVRGVRRESERRAAVEALKDLTYETFRAFYDAGQHLMLQRNMAGVTVYRFVPTPRVTTPRLMLVEEYRLSSFLGAYGVGRTLKTFSLLPGEVTKLTVRTASKSEKISKQASSILDSYSQETASEFESSLQQEQSQKSSSSEEMSASVEASASGSWGFGSASVSASASASTNSAREEFGKSVANSTSKHAARASASRNVQIDTSSQETTTTERSDETIREIRNINVGRTLNFVFRQMNQEFVSLLHLIDIRLGYTDGLEPMREYPLYELDELLARVMAADADVIAQTKKGVLEAVQTIRDYRGVTQAPFIGTVEGTTPARPRVNKDFVTRYTVATTGTKRSVPGVIISAKSIVMRTDDVVVEAVVGESSALDHYAEGLQDEEIRGRRLANGKQELENRLMQVEAQRGELLLELVRNKDVELLKLYNQSLNVLSGFRAPTRVVGVWGGESNGDRPTPTA